MTILITGGNGFIGSYVVRKLSYERIPVVILDKNESSGNVKNTIKADINDLDVLINVMKNYEIKTVVHLAGFPNINECEKDPITSFKLNVMTTQNVVEAMRKTDIKRIIFSSSAAVYGYKKGEKISENVIPRPDSIYGFHKLMSEEIIKFYAEKYGIKFVIFRLFNVFGGDPTFKSDVVSLFIKQILNKQPLILMGPKKFRDFIHIGDVAEAFFKVCSSNIENNIFNIGTGVPITLKQLADIFKNIVPNTSVVVKETPDDGTGIYADIALAKNVLSFSPRDPIQTLSRYIQKHLTSLYFRRGI
jgi:UDP-glucose 4-epimerase